MNRIRLLSEQVANQIAAGEVIERPASVVKELVENALDAMASHITVEVRAGGRGLIRVTDDGSGMSRDDALLCFERHATSKIQSADDLNAISSMGFRGEALPSIASVSRLSLTTRERDPASVEATLVQIDAGRVLGVRSASGPPGTCVEVRQLFFNLPARRKFMRSEETERAHIQHYILLAALAFPEVGFTFINEQRVVWQLPPVPSLESPEGRLEALRERMRVLYGTELNLVPLNAHADLRSACRHGSSDRRESDEEVVSELRIWGFVGAPGVSRATREDQHIFVNRRPIEHRGLNFALLEGYHTALMKGRYPVGCIFLELSPAEVDVNVHPAKREVRFRAEYAVRSAVTDAVRQALLGWHARHGAMATQTPASATGPEVAPKSSPAAPSPAAQTPVEPASLARSHKLPLAAVPDACAKSAQPPPSHQGTGAARDARPPDSSKPHGTALLTPQTSVASEGKVPSPSAAPGEITPARPPSDARSTGGEAAPLLGVPLRLVGVIGKLYVLFESDRGLVLLDQHAAHERVLYEQTLKRLEQGQAPCQRMLLPATVELSARDAEFLREQLATLNRLGVSLSEFGENTFLLDGLPPYANATEPRQFVLEVLDELKATGQAVNSLRLGEDMVARTVCRHAVKANDPLEGAELEGLLADLRRCAMPYTCPHGRPTIIEINYREIEKKFGRIT